jgi:undecaprenyl-diphosphatase
VAGRFIPFARMLISPLAGLSSMSLLRFSAYNFVGAAAWSAVFCGVGYFFGQHPPAFGRGLGRAALVVVLALGALALITVAGGWLVEESDAAWRAEGTLLHRLLRTAPLRWLAARSPRARAFLFRRFTPGDYLGLNLTLGLGLSFVTIVIFAALTNALMARDAVPQFDLALARALHDTATPASIAIWKSVSRLGALPVAGLPLVVLGVWFAVRRNWLPIIGLAGAAIGGVVLEVVVKHFLVHRHSAGSLEHAEVLGTPSGQAIASVVGYGVLAYFFVLLLPGRRRAMVIVTATACLVLAICFGRVYVGERYFSDVVSGVAAGGIWLTACITALEVARRRALRSTRVRAGTRAGDLSPTSAATADSSASRAL